MLNVPTVTSIGPVPGAARNAIWVMRRGPPTEANCPLPKSSWYSKLAGAFKPALAFPGVVSRPLGIISVPAEARVDASTRCKSPYPHSEWRFLPPSAGYWLINHRQPLHLCARSKKTSHRRNSSLAPQRENTRKVCGM